MSTEDFGDPEILYLPQPLHPLFGLDVEVIIRLICTMSEPWNVLEHDCMLPGLNLLTLLGNSVEPVSMLLGFFRDLEIITRHVMKIKHDVGYLMDSSF